MSTEEKRLIRLTEVRKISGLSRSSIYERSKSGLFPSSVNLGGRAVAWIEAEVRAWVNERIKESRTCVGNMREVRTSLPASVGDTR